jgi:SAM-dependent methyltransferase
MGDTTKVPDFAEEESFAESDSFVVLDDALWNPISTAAVARSNPGFDERVLDACCGDGASALPTAELVGTGGHVDAVDVAEALVEIVRERAGERMPQLHLHVADVTTWEPDGYDLVQCVLGIHFFPDLEADTRRLFERARPGGRVAITVWARGSFAPLPELLASAVQRDAASDDEHLTEPVVDLADTPGTVAQWLSSLGLIDVRAEAVQRHLDLTPEIAWHLVMGRPRPAIVAGLDDDELESVRRRYLAAIAERGVSSVDVTTVIAVGRRPEE